MDIVAKLNIGGAYLVRELAIFGKLTKFEHTVFALPFGLSAAFLVVDQVPAWWSLFWLLVALTGLRSFAMLANRLIDRQIDALNPRTQQRLLARSGSKIRGALIWAVVALLIFTVAVVQFERLAWYLAPLALVTVTVYPYLKRFTWLCHAGLGAVYLMLPCAVTIALTGGLTWAAILLGVGAAFWVVGFDILYALADREFDIRHGLYSIPAKFGVASALWTTRWLHLGCVVALIVAGVMFETGWLYFVGVGLTAALLMYENMLLKDSDLRRLSAAFFTTNGVVAVVFAVFTVFDRLLLG